MEQADRKGPVTLAHVAERAGVSKSTASKALAGRYGVSAATRGRVVAAAEELRFSPNLLARGLGGGRTHTVGIVTPDIDGRFAPQIMAGVEDALGTDRSSVIMCNSRGRDDLETHHIRELLQRSVDGLILVGNRPEPRAPIAVDSPVPVVYAFASSTDQNDTSVVCDNVEAGRMAVRHLTAMGKRRAPRTRTPRGIDDGVLRMVWARPIWSRFPTA
jgi:LacI family transcriptional regulator